ncbi:MAG: hypothetical protein Q9223_003930 [Gallowayella weberi]
MAYPQRQFQFAPPNPSHSDRPAGNLPQQQHISKQQPYHHNPQDHAFYDQTSHDVARGPNRAYPRTTNVRPQYESHQWPEQNEDSAPEVQQYDKSGKAGRPEQSRMRPRQAALQDQMNEHHGAGPSSAAQFKQQNQSYSSSSRSPHMVGQQQLFHRPYRADHGGPPTNDYDRSGAHQPMYRYDGLRGNNKPAHDSKDRSQNSPAGFVLQEFPDKQQQPWPVQNRRTRNADHAGQNPMHSPGQKHPSNTIYERTKKSARERIQMDPLSPETRSWDNPFPTFPKTKKKTGHVAGDTLSQSIGEMRLEDRLNVGQTKSSRPSAPVNDTSYEASPYHREILQGEQAQTRGVATRNRPPAGPMLPSSPDRLQHPYHQAGLPRDELRPQTGSGRHSEDTMGDHAFRQPGAYHGDPQRSKTMPNTISEAMMDSYPPNPHGRHPVAQDARHRLINQTASRGLENIQVHLVLPLKKICRTSITSPRRTQVTDRVGLLMLIFSPNKKYRPCLQRLLDLIWQIMADLLRYLGRQKDSLAASLRPICKNKVGSGGSSLATASTLSFLALCQRCILLVHHPAVPNMTARIEAILSPDLCGVRIVQNNHPKYYQILIRHPADQGSLNPVVNITFLGRQMDKVVHQCLGVALLKNLQPMRYARDPVRQDALDLQLYQLVLKATQTHYRLTLPQCVRALCMALKQLSFHDHLLPQISRPPREKSEAAAVTHEGLERLRHTIRKNPSDSQTQLLLAKKLVEATTVLANEGGRADAKTTARNRDKFNSEAYKVVKKLAQNGYPEAMFYLGDCYSRGSLGLESDPKEAFGQYQNAAKGGHAQAAYRVAVCCEMGLEEGGGTKRDALKAMQWYHRAATLGDTPAMYKLGVIQLKGLLGQPKNAKEALSWLERAAEQADAENPHAVHELALLYESSSGIEGLVKDEAHAKQLFMEAANLGYKFSQFRLGCAFEYGLLGCTIDPRQSIAWYSKAAVQDEHQSELALSGWYLTGSEGVLQQSDTEAYLWARKAAQAGLAKAEYAMGYFTEVGIGAPANIEDAKRWYWRSASQNFPKARERLEELRRGGAKMQKTRVSRSKINKQSEGECVVM